MRTSVYFFESNPTPIHSPSGTMQRKRPVPMKFPGTSRPCHKQPRSQPGQPEHGSLEHFFQLSNSGKDGVAETAVDVSEGAQERVETCAQSIEDDGCLEAETKSDYSDTTQFVPPGQPAGVAAAPRAPCAACPAEAARQSEAATSESGFAGRPEWEEFAEHTRRGEFDSPQFKEGLEKLKLSQESLALMGQIMLSVKNASGKAHASMRPFHDEASR